MATTPAVEFILKAKDYASKEIEKVLGKLTGLNAKQLELAGAFGRAAGPIGIFASAIGGAALTTYKAAEQFGESAVHLERMSGLAHSSAGEVQKLEYVFRRIGLTVQDSTRAIGFMAYSIGRDKQALSDLGIYTDNAVDALKQLGDVLGKSDQPAQRMRISVELLGRAGRVFAGVVPQMTAAVEAVDKAIAASGGAVTQHMAEMGFEFNNRADDIKFRLENLSLHLKAALVPAATAYLTIARQMLDAIGGLVPVLNLMGNVAVGVTGDLFEFFRAMDQIISGTKIAVAAISDFTNVLKGTSSATREFLSAATHLVFTVDVKPPDFDQFKAALDKMVEEWKNKWKGAFDATGKAQSDAIERQNDRAAALAKASADLRGADIWQPRMGPFQTEAEYALQAIENTTRLVDESGNLLSFEDAYKKLVEGGNQELGKRVVLLHRTAAEAMAADERHRTGGAGAMDLSDIGDLEPDQRARLAYEKVLGINDEMLQGFLLKATKSAKGNLEALKQVADLGPIMQSIPEVERSLFPMWDQLGAKIANATMMVEKFALAEKLRGVEREVHIFDPNAPKELQELIDKLEIANATLDIFRSKREARVNRRDIAPDLQSVVDARSIAKIDENISQVERRIAEIRLPQLDFLVNLDQQSLLAAAQHAEQAARVISEQTAITIQTTLPTIDLSNAEHSKRQLEDLFASIHVDPIQLGVDLSQDSVIDVIAKLNAIAVPGLVLPEIDLKNADRAKRQIESLLKSVRIPPIALGIDLDRDSPAKIVARLKAIKLVELALPAIDLRAAEDAKRQLEALFASLKIDPVELGVDLDSDAPARIMEKLQAIQAPGITIPPIDLGPVEQTTRQLEALLAAVHIPPLELGIDLKRDSPAKIIEKLSAIKLKGLVLPAIDISSAERSKRQLETLFRSINIPPAALGIDLDKDSVSAIVAKLRNIELPPVDLKVKLDAQEAKNELEALTQKIDRISTLEERFQTRIGAGAHAKGFIGPKTEAEDAAEAIVRLQDEIDKLEWNAQVNRDTDKFIREMGKAAPVARRLAVAIADLDFSQRGIELFERLHPDLARAAHAGADLYQALSGSEEEARALFSDIANGRSSALVMSKLAQDAIGLAKAMDRVRAAEAARNAVQDLQPLLIHGRAEAQGFDRAQLQSGVVEAIGEQFQEELDRATEATSVFRDLLYGMRDTLVGSFQDAFVGIIHGAITFSNAMRGIFRSMVDELIRQIGKLAALKVAGGFKSLFGALLGFIPGGGLFKGLLGLASTVTGGGGGGGAGGRDEYGNTKRLMPTIEEGGLLYARPAGNVGGQNMAGTGMVQQPASSTTYNVYTYDARNTIMELQSRSGSLRRANEYLQIVRSV